MLHETHPDVIKRLKRANGHLLGVIEMLEAGRPCVEIAQQLHAVGAAVEKAKRTLIHDHMDHCLGDAAGEAGHSTAEVLDELRTLAKFL